MIGSRHAHVRLLAVVVALALVGAACSSGSSSGSSGTTVVASSPSELPAGIADVMNKPRYADATWSLLVTDVDTGETFYSLNGDRLSYTGSTRKLFSVGMALNSLGADARQQTPVHRVGEVDAGGTLQGDLVLVAGGDLAFGGRRVDADTVAITDFDHNDANSLGTAELTPQDPLHALDQLAAQVEASGISAVAGDVVIDDRLFEPYRVPNGNLLITPMLVNENQVDVTVTPTVAGQPATITHRPSTAAFAVTGQVMTTPAGTPADIELSDDGLAECVAQQGCSGSVTGTIPEGYTAPLSGNDQFVGTFRVEDPDAFARTAFIEALQRHGVTVAATPVGPNPRSALPASTDYPAGTEVASYSSAPFAQNADLVLHVSLNLGANLDLSLFGLTKGARTVQDALAAERRTLIDDFGIDGSLFDFPTNGSGTPDSQAAPRALVQLLAEMAKTDVAGPYQAALPVLGVSGSLATSGKDLPARGHVFAKPGTSILPDADGNPVLKAQNLAGYIETKSGRKVAYALMVNDAGPVTNIAADVGGVFEDEAVISDYVYENL